MSTNACDIAGVLGLSRRRIETTFELAEALEKGLPVSSLERVCRLIAPNDPKFRDVLVARATFARRRQQKRLSLEEGERVERLARIWALALEVWGDAVATRRFLSEPHPLLHGRQPIDVAARTEVGARMVENILGRLKYGSAA